MRLSSHVLCGSQLDPRMLLLAYVLCIGLAVLPRFVVAHPQCLDFQPPFESTRLQQCQEYKDFGCCVRDEHLERRVDRLLELRLSAEQQELCDPFIRNVSCLECSPYAAHIYESESGNESRVFPLLCRSYCEEAFQICNPLMMRYFSLRAGDYGISNWPKTHEELVENSKVFCAANLPSNDSAYCYPKVLNGPQVPDTTESEDGELNCLCTLPVATGLRNPIAAVHAGDRSGRLFIAEQLGIVWVLMPNNTLLSDPFLDISSRVLTSSRVGDERGFLGLAFHPQYKDNGLIYVYYSAGRQHKSRVSEFRLKEGDPNKINVTSERIILSIPQPYSNHNGGQLLFKDGYLLIVLGDGGGAGDRLGHGQDRSTLHGSILRIDVDNKDPGLEYAIPESNPFVGNTSMRPEIYAYGLRNPWRCSIDRGERGRGGGRLFCGDVGQRKFEEVDIIEKGGNYGWRAFEGHSCFDSTLCNEDSVEDAISPIDVYDHQTVGVSVTGGYVYRGCLYPNLNGLYIFGDYGSGKVFALRENKTSEEWSRTELCMGDSSTCTGSLVGVDRAKHILSFGEDEDGELYMLTTNSASPTRRQGVVYQIIDPARREYPRKCRNIRDLPITYS